jgi:hypothetical protein
LTANLDNPSTQLFGDLAFTPNDRLTGQYPSKPTVSHRTSLVVTFDTPATVAGAPDAIPGVLEGRFGFHGFWFPIGVATTVDLVSGVCDDSSDELNAGTDGFGAAGTWMGPADVYGFEMVLWVLEGTFWFDSCD